MSDVSGCGWGWGWGSMITSWLFLKTHVATEMADVKGMTNRRDGDP